MRDLNRIRRPELTFWRVTFVVAAAVGLVLRIWVYRATLGTPNADEAVVGLMTRHALDGEYTTFYWGQAYGGTQEVLLTVPLFLVAGSSWLALRLIPIALGAVTALLVWRVGRRTIGEPAAGVAGAVFWLWPPFNVFQLTHQQGFYASNVFYCALLLLLALRVYERPDRTRVGLLGLASGLAFWQTPQIVPVAAGVIAWTIWKQPRSIRQLWVAVPLAVLGALPWLVWNFQHDFESLAVPDYGDKVRSLRLLVSPVLPMMVGLRAPFSAELLIPSTPVTFLVYAVLAGLFAYGASRTWRRSVSILYVVTVVFPFVYVISPKTTWAVGTPRFIVVLTPVLALLLAQLATTRLRAVAVLTLACFVSVVTLHRMDVWFRDVPGHTTNAKGLGPRHAVQWVPRDLGPLISTLDRLDLDRVYAEYWLAYRLSFDSEERIIAAQNEFKDVRFEGGVAIPPSPVNLRYEPYERQVARARHGFVFYREILESIPIVDELERKGFRRHDAGEYVILAPDG